jgi:N-acetylglutamate synthase-like GNAT family acetyltransferase
MTADATGGPAASIGPGPTVRPTRKDDVPKVHAFIRPFVSAGRLLERTIEELDLLVGDGFVAEEEGRIVGFAALEVYSKKLAELRSLAVAPGYQGLGLGRRLVEACVGRAREKNVLEVMAITSSDEFFLACGFDFTLPGEKKALFYQTRGR